MKTRGMAPPGVARALTMAVAILFACAILVAAPSARAEPIKIGVLPTSGSGPMYIAKAKGYFADEGLEAEIISFDSSQTLAVELAASELDFGATSLSASHYNLAAQGLLRIIAAQGRDNPGFPNNGVVVSNAAWDAGLRSFKDLRGHSIGVTTLGSAPHYCVGLLADKYGFPMSSVDVQTLKTNPNIVATIAGGRIDAAVTPSTFALSIGAKGQGKLLGWIGDESPWQLGAVYTSTKLADGKPELVGKFLRAYRHGMRDYYDAFISPDGQRKDGASANDMLAIMSPALNLPVELLREGITYVDRDARLDAKDIRRQIVWYKSQDLIKGDVDADALLDKRYAIFLPEK